MRGKSGGILQCLTETRDPIFGNQASLFASRLDIHVTLIPSVYFGRLLEPENCLLDQKAQAFTTGWNSRQIVPMSTTSPEGVYACSTVVPVLSIVAVVLRFYTRSRQKVGLQFDDWAQVPALVCFLNVRFDGRTLFILLRLCNSTASFHWHGSFCPHRYELKTLASIQDDLWQGAK